MKLFGIISAGLDILDQLLLRFSAFFRYWRKKWEYDETVHQLFTDFKTANSSVATEVLYNILIEFGVPIKLVRLITMCLNGAHGEVRIGKPLLNNFLIQNALSPLLFKFTLEYTIRKIQVGLKLNAAHQLLAYVGDVNLLGDIVNIIKNTETSVDASKKVSLDIGVEETNICYCLVT
jgi:hypothetical protein